MKFVFLKVPKTYGVCGKDAVMGFIKSPPTEFQMDKYMDKNKQFEKTFKEPLENITTAIGWQLNPQVSLESFFV